jgi:hypothetical protein
MTILPTDRDNLYARILKLYGPYMDKFPDAKMAYILRAMYGVDQVRLMTIQQLTHLVSHMESVVLKERVSDES